MQAHDSHEFYDDADGIQIENGWIDVNSIHCVARTLER